MERGVEHRDLLHARQDLFDRKHAFEIGGVVQRGDLEQRADLRLNVLGDDATLGEELAAVGYAVADGLHFVERRDHAVGGVGEGVEHELDAGRVVGNRLVKLERLLADGFMGQVAFVTIKNTIVISLYTIAVTFPLPIIMALMVNQIRSMKFKKFLQVATYLPHFISVVVMSGMIILFLSPSTGIIAKLVGLLGFKLPNLMGSASAFPHIYVWTEAWQHVGWDSILYIATLSSVDPSLYEAATMDGANKWHKIVNIDLPSLVPTATVMFILRMGSVMSVGFEKVYLLQNNLNSSSSEIISTYVYKMGLVSNQYSLSAAIGLFNNIINLVLLIAVNMIAKKVSDTSLV